MKMRSKCHRPLSCCSASRVGRSAFLLVALLSVGGCLKSNKVPRLELGDVFLVTPAGNHRLDASDVGKRIEIQLPTLSIRVLAPGLTVTLGAFAQQPQVRVMPKQGNRNVQFESEGAFYQLSGGAEVALHGIQAEMKVASGQWIASQWRIDLPPALTKIKLASSRPPPDVTDAIEAIGGETQRFYIPFRIDGERYALDASFVLEVERVWSIGSIGGLP